jgi:hypothetical protein
VKLLTAGAVCAAAAEGVKLGIETDGVTTVLVGYVDIAAVGVPAPQGGTPHVTETINVLPLLPNCIEPIGVLIEYVLKGPFNSPTFVALVKKPPPPTPAYAPAAAVVPPGSGAGTLFP